MVAKARARRSQRGIGQSDARQPSHLLGGGAEHLGSDAAVVAERDVEDFGHFAEWGYCAKRRSVS